MIRKLVRLNKKVSFRRRTTDYLYRSICTRPLYKLLTLFLKFALVFYNDGKTAIDFQSVHVDWVSSRLAIDLEVYIWKFEFWSLFPVWPQFQQVSNFKYQQILMVKKVERKRYMELISFYIWILFCVYSNNGKSCNWLSILTYWLH